MTGNERRTSERYPIDTEIHFYSLLAGEPVACKAQVHDVSEDGMGLYVSSFGWFSPGDALVIVLPGEESGQLVVAQVIHLHWQEDGWLLGCLFWERLSIEELEWLRQTELVGMA